MICPNCGNHNIDNATFCRLCHESFASNSRVNAVSTATFTCPSCKTQYQKYESYCDQCGAKMLAKKQTLAKQKDSSVTAVIIIVVIIFVSCVGIPILLAVMQAFSSLLRGIFNY